MLVNVESAGGTSIGKPGEESDNVRPVGRLTYAGVVKFGKKDSPSECGHSLG